MSEKEKLEKRLQELKFKQSKLIKEKAASPTEIMNKNLQTQGEIAEVEKKLVSLK